MSNASEVHVTINGQTVVGRVGSTVLELALTNGIVIPHLCDGAEPWGSCGLCLVEVEGRPQPVRACCLTAEEGMVVNSRTKRVQRDRRLILELMLSEHTGDCTPPCSMACPAGVDSQGALAALARGDFRQAAAVWKDALPLPGAIGLTCRAFCRSACRRRYVEEPLSIPALQVWTARADLNSGHPVCPSMAPDSGQSVCVVGGSLRGLSTAYFLCRLGHRVTVVEESPKMGGVLRERCPDTGLLERELAWLEGLGIRFRNSCGTSAYGDKEYGFDLLIPLPEDGEDPAREVARGQRAAAEAHARLTGEVPKSRPAILCRTQPSDLSFQDVPICPGQPLDGGDPVAVCTEASRCLECGCSAYPDCGLLREINAAGIRPGRLSRVRLSGPVPLTPGLIYARNKCLLCGRCVRACRETGRELLSLAGKGRRTTLIGGLPAGADSPCAGCLQCLEACPTGALSCTLGPGAGEKD